MVGYAHTSVRVQFHCKVRFGHFLSMCCCHRIREQVKLEGTTGDHLVQLSAHAGSPRTLLLGIVPRWLLNIFRDIKNTRSTRKLIKLYFQYVPWKEDHNQKWKKKLGISQQMQTHLETDLLIWLNNFHAVLSISLWEVNNPRQGWERGLWWSSLNN